MKEKIKSYGFWVSLSGAVVVLVETIGKAVGFIPNGEIISNIIMGIAGILVVFGVVSMPPKESEKKTETNPDGNELSIKEETSEDKDIENEDLGKEIEKE